LANQKQELPVVKKTLENNIFPKYHDHDLHSLLSITICIIYFRFFLI
jgi:hypothetical protein